MRLQCRVPGKGCQLGLQVRIVPRLGLDQEKDASNICIRQPPQVRPGNSSTIAVSTTTAATTETSGQNMNTCQTDPFIRKLANRTKVTAKKAQYWDICPLCKFSPSRFSKNSSNLESSRTVPCRHNMPVSPRHALEHKSF